MGYLVEVISGVKFDEYCQKRDPAWGHGGGDPGVSTQMLFRPKDGVGVIVFFNFDGPGKEFGEILERLFEEGAKFRQGSEPSSQP